MNITGRSNGVSADTFTKYILDWVQHADLENKWKRFNK